MKEGRGKEAREGGSNKGRKKGKKIEKGKSYNLKL